jgi:hypothetical protein
MKKALEGAIYGIGRSIGDTSAWLKTNTGTAGGAIGVAVACAERQIEQCESSVWPSGCACATCMVANIPSINTPSSTASFRMCARSN